uniref:Mitochondrial adapter protein MCP1 transmembrane domain-containing protein n=1 Tax=Moniliophthora roreri TaxID=221103 RepID=A0A0W0FFA7_MONRR
MALHSFSGIAKRLVDIAFPPTAAISANQASDSEIKGKGAEQKSRRWPSLLASTAYPLIPLFTLHFMTHRGIPSSPSSPLHSSELDFEFVKFHLQTYPKLSWFLYGSLLALTLIHGVEGVVVVWNRYYPGLRLRQLGKAKWARIAAVLTGIGGTVISGLWFISREVPMVFPDMLKRFDRVLRIVPFYRV